ncbi:LytR/AlgR family response regulator transcription factor [Alkaliphilus sp. B6464]|uniref:LytR/AlgR family response regulator transcription factor n=1 Tax=Alkaliphilus sp. B6464 TaxID=2731219 RepID=UPI001BAAD48C|nr:LytTR family DNA-binding domain-containing protein [Alkaliphilus sp. B6464]QUH21913.1 response regulator transcription factor [Alkaliphilus sp. B6464]
MLNIIICEDDKRFKNSIDEYVLQYISTNGIQGEIKLTTNDPYKVIDYVKENNHSVNVYFLDIALKSDINGLILAKEIRKHDMNGYLIFVTGHPELTLKTFQYKLKALDYICKGDNNLKKRISECLDVVVSECNKLNLHQNNDILFIKSGANFYSIPYGKIIFIETTINHKIIIHTLDNQIEVYGSLSEIGEKLNKDFYRCHRSFIINFKHIKRINLNRNDLYVIMQGDHKCFISKKFLKGVINYANNN